MKTVLILFLLFFACLYSMDVAPYKYPSSFIIESQRTLDVPLHALGFLEHKAESLNLDTCREYVSKVPLKQLVYEEWLTGNFLLLARVVLMPSEQKPTVSWWDMRTLVNAILQSPRGDQLTIPNATGEILCYCIPHDRYMSSLCYLYSEKDLNTFRKSDFRSLPAQLTKFLALYHIEKSNNQRKLILLESITKLASLIDQEGEQYIHFVKKHYQSLLPTLKLLCKKKRSRKDHKLIASQELHKGAMVDSQLQLGYRYLRRHNNDEAKKWLSMVSEQEFFPEKRKDAEELLDYLNDGVPLLCAKKAQFTISANIRQLNSRTGKDAAEEYH